VLFLSGCHLREGGVPSTPRGGPLEQLHGTSTLKHIAGQFDIACRHNRSEEAETREHRNLTNLLECHSFKQKCAVLLNVYEFEVLWLNSKIVIVSYSTFNNI